MPRARARGNGHEGHINMTPMIDVVFQLIIFFMLVSELTNLALEPVILPVAQYAKERGRGSGELVVNIKLDDTGKEGIVVIGGDQFPGRGQALVEKLKTRLQLEAEAFNEWTPNRNHPTGRNSELEVLVRADRQVPSEYFLWLMWACNDVGVYKVQVSARQFRLPE